MKIGWFGLGKLGMISSEMLVKKGHTVTGYDKEERFSGLVRVSKTPKEALPDKLEPPKKNVQVTAGNVYTTGGARSREPKAGGRTAWTAEEEEVFMTALGKHGVGAWALILSDPEFELVSVVFC